MFLLTVNHFILVCNELSFVSDDFSFPHQHVLLRYCIKRGIGVNCPPILTKHQPPITPPNLSNSLPPSPSALPGLVTKAKHRVPSGSEAMNDNEQLKQMQLNLATPEWDEEVSCYVCNKRA